MKYVVYTLSLFLLTSNTFGQITIPATAVIAATTDTEIGILTFGNITNNSTFDFSQLKLSVELTGATQQISGDLVAANFSLNGIGAKTLNSKLTVTNSLTFAKGILTPTATGKILFTGPEDGVSGGDNSSYYNGIFYSEGTGRRVFPIGISGAPNVYAPVIIDNITDNIGEISVRAVNGSALLDADTAELIDVNQERYWEITSDPTLLNSRVALGLEGFDAYLSGEGGASVVESESIGGVGKNLGGASITEGVMVVSSKQVTAPILAVGREKKITVKVRDLITPYTPDNVNDKLTIEHIGRFATNKVTLLDRYGVQVAQWKNFTNDVNYDFSRLGPGNYICIVEYGNPDESTKVIQQMVTVLKTN
jgi:hypothetical protein